MEFSPSGLRPLLPFWRKRHLPRIGGVCLAEGGKAPGPLCEGAVAAATGGENLAIARSLPLHEAFPLGEGVCGPDHRRMRGSLPEIARKRAVSAGSALISHLR